MRAGNFHVQAERDGMQSTLDLNLPNRRPRQIPRGSYCQLVTTVSENGIKLVKSLTTNKI